MVNENPTINPIDELTNHQLTEADFRNDSDKHQIHHHSPFALEGHWQPWYNDKEDFNTNALSYYEYLAHRNEHLRLITELLNRVARRNISVVDTNSIDFTKTFDWIKENDCNLYHDIIELKADVKRSLETREKVYTGTNFNITKTVSNEILEFTDGIWSPDWSDLLSDIMKLLDTEITDRKVADNNLNSKIDNLDSKLTDKINELEKTINDKIDAINDKIREIINNISTIKTIQQAANVQPPYQVIEFDKVSGKVIDRNTQPTPPNKRFGLEYAKLEVREDGEVISIYEWLKPASIDYDIKPEQENITVATCPIETVRNILSENMFNQLNYYHKQYYAIDKSLDNILVEISVNNEKGVVEFKHMKRATGQGQYQPIFDNVNPWLVITNLKE